jgi:predicted nuclease of predicted toxin-antitoxin system
MKFLIDMNLSPDWCPFIAQAGWEVLHWTTVGNGGASDHEIMAWARRSGYIVFTHDLDFGAMLAATGARGPSVIQLRSEDTRPNTMAAMVLAAIESHQEALEFGALVTVDPRKMRVTLLPLISSE